MRLTIFSASKMTRVRDLFFSVFSLLVLQGCAAAILATPILVNSMKSDNSKVETGNKINIENISLLEEGKSTKTDVISLFGIPAPVITRLSHTTNKGLNGTPTAILSSGDNTLMIYKYCITKSKERGKLAAAIRGGKDFQVKCEQLAILLDKQEVVSVYSYHKDDPLTENNVKKLSEKKTRTDVIKLLGAPMSISESMGDELYIYKSCELTGTRGNQFGFSERSVSEHCAQLVIVLDKNKGKVKSYRYQP